MRWSYDYVPARIFSTVGYCMFAFLFQWTDTNWFVDVPCSLESLVDYVNKVEAAEEENVQVYSYTCQVTLLSPLMTNLTDGH
jgi:hypothetical protein